MRGGFVSESASPLTVLVSTLFLYVEMLGLDLGFLKVRDHPHLQCRGL